MKLGNVQWRERNVQKSVMHVQSCFAYLRASLQGERVTFVLGVLPEHSSRVTLRRRRSSCLRSLRSLISLTPTDVLYKAPLPLTFTSSLILQYIRKKIVRARQTLEFQHVLWASSFHILPGATICLLDWGRSPFFLTFSDGNARAREQRAKKPRNARKEGSHVLGHLRGSRIFLTDQKRERLLVIYLLVWVDDLVGGWLASTTVPIGHASKL